ncbi:TraB/GumN family protein [Alkalihalobacillus oceani]|uniref:TraB/GumN family protein n=1 Tax=Halalkalibacter oceani TaxID=1653776 RepID=UPI00203F7E8B|nr:TraB/GumN family protein [Halalkalibacter oceani]MCM3760421.1 TraB/GumN family protein [Halalkalibacter oceani]
MRETINRSGLLLAFILALFMISGCQDEGADQEAMAGPGGFLWEVENGDTKMYLQGTIHIGEEDFFPLNGYSEEAYEAADVVLPEVDLNNLDEEAVQAATMELAIYDDGTTIQDHIPAELYAELSAAVGEFGMEMMMLEMYKPWFFELLLTELYTGQAGYSFDYAVDTYFLDRAEEDQKEVVALETYEDQLTMLAGFSEEHQIRSLEYMLSGRDQLEEETHQIVEVWKEGDLEGLVEVNETEDVEFLEQFMYEINEVRNIKMAEQLVELLENGADQTYFVIVGAMHFVEEPSIVSLLEDSGFEVNHIY